MRNMLTAFEKHTSCIKTSISLVFLWPKKPIYEETCLYECLLAHYTAESVKDSQTKFQMFLQVSGRHVGVLWGAGMAQMAQW